MDTKRMRVCATLLPAPGDEVVIECIDEIERLRHALELIRAGQKEAKEAKNTNIVDYIDAVLTPNAQISGGTPSDESGCSAIEYAIAKARDNAGKFISDAAMNAFIEELKK